MINIGINGFGRMGRLAAREILKDSKFNLVSINHPTINTKDMTKLLTYDSVHGQFNINKDKKITIHNERNPENIKWESYLDVIIETTGLFKELKQLETYQKHPKTKIIVSAPSNTLPMFIYGVNHDKYNNNNIISAASCTTTCLAPVVQILHNEYNIRSGLATTIHSVTASQTAVDKYKPGSRTGRSLLNNILPSSTGAATSIGKIIPELDGKLNAISVRVPVQNVSLLDLTVELENFPTIEDIRENFLYHSKNKYNGIIDVNSHELVSSDFIGNSHTSIIDYHGMMQEGDLYKMMVWYDNEFGYVKNLLRLVHYMH
jgi:glyceraldehyde 3-phosphate dehydrogenase